MHVFPIDMTTPYEPGAETKDPIAIDVARADARFSALLAEEKDAKNTLREITQDGAKSYWEWKMKELRRQAAEKIMGEMNLTEEKIAAMLDKERLAVENQILQYVEQQVRLAVEQEMKRRQQATLTLSGSLQSIIQKAQEVGGLT